MKKISMFFFAVALIGFAAACNKEVAYTEPENEVADEFELADPTVICATISEDETKARIDGTTGGFTWMTGDKIAVYAGGWKVSDALSSGGYSSASFSFTDNPVVDANRADFAVYPSDLVTTHSASNNYHSSTELDIAMPHEYKLDKVEGGSCPCPMIATNAPGGGLVFKHICAILRISVKNVPLSATTLRVDFGDVYVGGGGVVELKDVVPGTTYATPSPYGGNKYFDINLESRVSYGGDWITVNLPVPVATYNSITVSARSGSTVISSVTSPLKSDSSPWNATRAKGRKVKVILPPHDAFSVSATKKVRFAPGNLQAITTDLGATWTWKFAEHQYDIIGNNAANTAINGVMTVSTNGTVDMFGYVGKSVSAEKDCYGINNSTTAADYGTKYAEDLKHDWGELAIGSYSAGTWRSLIWEEVNYLVSSRTVSSTNLPEGTNSSAAKYVKATVCGVKGMILFPDKYIHPDGITVTGASSKTYNGTSGYDKFVVAADAYWKKMADAGAVFLPAAGVRIGTNVSEIGTTGCYWTKSGYASYDTSYFLYFTAGYCEYSSRDRQNGCAVRLVRDLE